jgi:hypothetical protein
MRTAASGTSDREETQAVGSTAETMDRWENQRLLKEVSFDRFMHTKVETENTD